MKYLGILLNSGMVNMIKDNFDLLLQKIQLLFKGWDKLLMSLWGRVQVIKNGGRPHIDLPLMYAPSKHPYKYF